MVFNFEFTLEIILSIIALVISLINIIFLHVEKRKSESIRRDHERKILEMKEIFPQYIEFSTEITVNHFQPFKELVKRAMFFEELNDEAKKEYINEYNLKLKELEKYLSMCNLVLLQNIETRKELENITQCLHELYEEICKDSDKYNFELIIKKSAAVLAAISNINF